MAECPECQPIADELYRVGVLVTDLKGQTEPLRRSLSEGLRPFAERVHDATEARLQAEAEHAHWVVTVANMVAEISAMTGAGATAVASAFANDYSFTPVEGWLEHRVSPTLTMWFRNEEAIAQFGKASGLDSALAGLERARAEEARTLQAVRDANARESQAQDALDQAEEDANARLRAHYDQIAAAEADHRRLNQEYLACLERCRRGDARDARVGVAGAAMMFAGLLLVATSGLFGGDAEAATGGDGAAPATATSTAAAAATSTPEAPPVDFGALQAGPIGAIFMAQQFTTYYTLPVTLPDGTDEASVAVAWSGADCAAWYNEGPFQFVWNHPHPPCDATTDHADRTIRATVTVAGRTLTCEYRGAHSGVGAPCAWADGSTVAVVGDAPQPAPTTTGSTDPTATATVEGPTATPSASPGPTETTTSGGGTVARPTPEPAPAGEETGSGGTGGGAAAAGLGLTVAGGAALGYASSRRGGTRTREPEPGDGDDGDGTRVRERPCVEIDTFGRGDDSVTRDQAFRIRVRRPRPPSGDPPETIDVGMESVQSTGRESLRLRWTGNVGEPAEYVSEPVSIKDGGSGGGKVTVLGLEFSTGDMGRGLSSVPDGTDVRITVDGCTTTFTVYNTWVQQGIGRTMDAIRQQRAFWTTLAQLLANEPDSPEKESLLRHAREVIRVHGDAERIRNNDQSLDTMKLALLQAAHSIITRDLASWDRREEASIYGAATRAGREMGMDSFMRGLSGAAVGMWRTAADVTGYASYLKVRYGFDEMGTRVGTLERIFAAIDIAGKVTLYGQTARSLGSIADFMRGQGATRGALRVTERTSDALRAEAGRAVEFTEEFGMLRNRAGHFSSVAERYDVRIRVRPANEASLSTMADGHPPKHVKLKSKTVNEIDELIGAPLGRRGQVGYFEPRLPPLDNFEPATRDAILKRFSQRSLEFHDEAEAMASLEKKGLVRVEGGVVVDTGLSDTRLVGHELQPMGRNPGGTGKAFTGDHDMWDITRSDGRPLDAATKARVEAELMDGVAATQHGPHKDWVPQTAKDRAIDARIRAGHGGEVGADGVVRARPGSEALLEFLPGQPPRVSYELPGQ